jgi:hypothetical protein
VAELFSLLASQPSSSNLQGPAIFNEKGPQSFVTKVQGVLVTVHHQCSEASILAAEAVIGSMEALFATTIDLHATAHTENFDITIQEDVQVLSPDFAIDSEDMTASVGWPAGLLPATFGRQEEIQKMLIGLAAAVFAATCFVKDVQETGEQLFKIDAVLDRIAMVVIVGNSRQRIFKASVSRLRDWTKMAASTFTLEPLRPVIGRCPQGPGTPPQDGDNQPVAGDRRPPVPPNDHRDLGVLSVIDVHLWNRAGWFGAAFADWGPHVPPGFALVFTNEEAARKIFTRWRERLGRVDKQDKIYLAIVRGIAADHPAHYRVLVTSRLPTEGEPPAGRMFAIASRMLTMHAESDCNINRFLDVYGRARAYLLLPAILVGGAPKFLPDFAIRKRQLSVKAASDVNEFDLEAMALGPEQYRARFGAAEDGAVEPE